MVLLNLYCFYFRKSIFVYKFDKTSYILYIDNNLSIILPDKKESISVILTGHFLFAHYDILAPVK